MERTPSSLMTVRFQDCDPFNHLNNGRYVDYFLNAREDHLLEHYGLDIYKVARETGLSWVVSTNQIAYLRPAVLMERVRIESQLIAYGPRFVQVELRMWNEAHTELKAFCWMAFVHYDLRAQKTATHSEQYMELFHTLHLPMEESDFNARMKGLSGR